ncbi:uncharacterized protein LOC118741612 [Rhagoletis pomonella]|uniref:uncharacterized protein LOC118741608 n=1 Tax=Rhagoletis pomonella TaxID=28610 RepID=UPI00177CA199|nr:uncharacterized protein LOC118741608 [Rhagoletis pomonella]XP_036329497.1 uncharacterized protein LOC118741612 [Rhagoletis pomonella]
MLDVLPQLTEDFMRITANKFMALWNFPNCVGAIDGKHIRKKSPNNSGSLFFNYKEYYSMVLLAIVDADCKFLAVDVGSHGREGDAGIYLKSNIGRRIQNIEFKFPAPHPLPESTEAVPCSVVPIRPCTRYLYSLKILKKSIDATNVSERSTRYLLISNSL